MSVVFLCVWVRVYLLYNKVYFHSFAQKGSYSWNSHIYVFPFSFFFSRNLFKKARLCMSCHVTSEWMKFYIFFFFTENKEYLKWCYTMEIDSVSELFIAIDFIHNLYLYQLKTYMYIDISPDREDLRVNFWWVLFSFCSDALFSIILNGFLQINKIIYFVVHTFCFNYRCPKAKKKPDENIIV